MYVVCRPREGDAPAKRAPHSREPWRDSAVLAPNHDAPPPLPPSRPSPLHVVLLVVVVPPAPRAPATLPEPHGQRVDAPPSAPEEARRTLLVVPPGQRAVPPQHEREVGRREVLRTAHLVEAADVVLGLPVFHDQERRHDDDPELLHEVPRAGAGPPAAVVVAPLHVDPDEPRLGVLGRELRQAAVEDVAAPGRRAVEVHDEPVRGLRQVEERFGHVAAVLTPADLLVGPVAGLEPLGPLVPRGLHLLQPPFPQLLEVAVGRVEEGVVPLDLFVDGRLLRGRCAQDGRRGIAADGLVRVAEAEVHLLGPFRWFCPVSSSDK